MAKNPFILYGASGKVGNIVVQKGANGQTVVREYKIPKNPRTIPQMLQRFAFGTVTQAASIMDKLVNHSFEGVQSPAENRKKFIAMNTMALKTNLISDYRLQKEGETATGFVTAKNNKTIVPNNYTISTGSLSLPSWARVFRHPEDSYQLLMGNFDGSTALIKNFTYENLFSILQIPIGCEWSMHAIYSAPYINNLPPRLLVVEAENPGKVLIESKYKGLRIAFKNAISIDLSKKVFTTEIANLENITDAEKNALKREFINAVKECIDEAKSSSVLLAVFYNMLEKSTFTVEATIGADGPIAQFTLGPINTADRNNVADLVGGQFTYAAQGIISLPDNSKRSTSIMVRSANEPVDVYIYGLDVWAALAVLNNTSLEDIFNNWLNQGGFDNEI